jgi:hypothetical protein
VWVIVGGLGLAREWVILPAHLGRGHPLLLLAPVAEPDPHHLLLQLQALRQLFLGDRGVNTIFLVFFYEKVTKKLKMGKDRQKIRI